MYGMRAFEWTFPKYTFNRIEKKQKENHEKNEKKS